MKVLVVCPTYGRLPFLGRVLASFLSQTYKNSKLVIVNDNKNVRLECDEDRVVCINVSHRMLTPQKRNLGNSFDYSDLIMPFDDDDIFLPRRIENHVMFHMMNPEVGAYMNSECYTVSGDKFKPWKSGVTFISYKKSSWMEAGGYRHNKESGEDKEFWLKLKSKVIKPGVRDYVYNWGGVNYHSTYSSEAGIEKIANKQLIDMGVMGGAFKVVPDFEEYNKFVELDRIFNGEEIKIKHNGLGKIIIP